MGRMTRTLICTTPGCARPPLVHRTVCPTCRYRTRRYGNPLHGGPADDYDETDVELIVQQRRPSPGLTRAERHEVAIRLTRKGVSGTEIARILQVSRRTVCRWRAAARQQTALA